ncbi:MAG: hypothetical protein M1826_004642 [Phylliscum demangeonii]|nr:MAG: hypothetical protein M1826_004642 [Phylliscum demangeonii]
MHLTIRRPPGGVLYCIVAVLVSVSVSVSAAPMPGPAGGLVRRTYSNHDGSEAAMRRMLEEARQNSRYHQIARLRTDNEIGNRLMAGLPVNTHITNVIYQRFLQQLNPDIPLPPDVLERAEHPDELNNAKQLLEVEKLTAGEKTEYYACLGYLLPPTETIVRPTVHTLCKLYAERKIDTIQGVQRELALAEGDPDPYANPHANPPNPDPHPYPSTDGPGPGPHRPNQFAAGIGHLVHSTAHRIQQAAPRLLAPLAHFHPDRAGSARAAPRWTMDKALLNVEGGY